MALIDKFMVNMTDEPRRKYCYWLIIGTIAASLITVLGYYGLKNNETNANGTTNVVENDYREILYKVMITGAIRLLVTTTGPFVAAGNERSFETFVFPKTIGINGLFVPDFFLNFNKPNGEQYQMTMIDGKGFSAIFDPTTDAFKDQPQCLKDGDIVNIGKLANVMMNSTVLLKASDKLQNAMQCDLSIDGNTLLVAKWDHNEYVVCVKTEAGTGDKIISRILGEHYVVDVTYLSDSETLKAETKYLKAFPQTFVKNVSAECNELKLTSSIASLIFDADLYMKHFKAGINTLQENRDLLTWIHPSILLLQQPQSLRRRLDSIHFENTQDLYRLGGDLDDAVEINSFLDDPNVPIGFNLYTQNLQYTFKIFSFNDGEHHKPVYKEIFLMLSNYSAATHTSPPTTN